MNRSEIEEAICDAIDIDNTFGRERTRSSGLGEDALILLYEYFRPDARRHESRRGRKCIKRRRIADLLDLELDPGINDDPRVSEYKIDRNFRKEELEQILDCLQSRPEQNTWESVLSWPPQAEA